MVEILAGDDCKLALLAAIHRGFRRFHISRGARLDFHKTQHIFVPSDQIDLAAPARRAKIACHHDVTQLSQIKVSVFFAATTGALVLWPGCLCHSFIRQPVESLDRGMCKSAREHWTECPRRMITNCKLGMAG